MNHRSNDPPKLGMRDRDFLRDLQRDDRKETVIANHGEEKWKSMLEHLSDPDKILWTYSCILPNFLNQAIGITVEA